MGRGSRIGLAAFAACSLAVCLSITAFNAEKDRSIVADGPSPFSVTLNSEALATINLTNVDLGKSDPDKKFRIPLEGGKYIDGAIIFRDCGHQYTGDTLGAAFGIDNSEQAGANAYNFNILFSLENALGLGVNFTIGTFNTEANECARAIVKYAHLDGDFYTAIKTHYDRLTPTITGDSVYDSSDQYSASFWLSQSSVSGEVSKYLAAEPAHNYNVVAFQFTNYPSYPIQAGNAVSCTLTELSISYSCKA